MSDVKGFETKRPGPQPVVHRREFTEAEIAEALREWLENRGVTVPKGSVSLYGLASPRNYALRPTLRLTITETRHD